MGIDDVSKTVNAVMGMAFGVTTLALLLADWGYGATRYCR
jgi:hypothetical protein